MLSRYLGGNGLRVSVAGDGAQLRAAMREPAFDLVLLDLGLPDEDGLALIRDLRARWQGPVIIVSGRGDSIERIVGLEMGADDYVTKPFELRELLARIRTVLRRARSAPATWARIKPGRSSGRMPEKVSVKDRAIETAGLANDVDAVNQ